MTGTCEILTHTYTDTVIYSYIYIYTYRTTNIYYISIGFAYVCMYRIMYCNELCTMLIQILTLGLRIMTMLADR